MREATSAKRGRVAGRPSLRDCSKRAGCWPGAAMSSRAMLSRLHDHGPLQHSSRGVQPYSSSSAADEGAASSSSCTTVAWPLPAATCSGRRPLLPPMDVTRAVAGTAASSSRTASTRPRIAAQWKGVCPKSSWAAAAAGQAATSNLTSSKLDRNSPWCSAFLPYSSATATRAAGSGAAASRRRTRSTSPAWTAKRSS